MQRIGLQIFSLAMNLLVLVSAVSWTVDQHICMGRVVSTAVFSEAAGCGMAMSEDNPMANSNKGAKWLITEEQIRNPFLGR